MSSAPARSPPATGRAGSQEPLDLVRREARVPLQEEATAPATCGAENDVPFMPSGSRARRWSAAGADQADRPARP